MMPLRSSTVPAPPVFTTMPSIAGVVQEAGVPRCPSISTTHIRHAPKDFIPG